MKKKQKRRNHITNYDNLDQAIKFRVLEAYKTARTNLSFSILKDGCKKIVVTSSLQSEGKTTTSVNLAKSLADQINVKVLLIDCDLRKPTVNLYFEKPNNPGLTDLLTKTNSFEEVLTDTDNDNLKVIFSGTIPPNPSEILASVQMKSFIEGLEDSYDYIVFDTPPLNVVVDSLPLIKNSDGVVLSVMQSQSKHTELAKTLSVLKSIDAKILGFILNGVKENIKSGYYKYGY